MGESGPRSDHPLHGKNPSTVFRNNKVSALWRTDNSKNVRAKIPVHNSDSMSHRTCSASERRKNINHGCQFDVSVRIGLGSGVMLGSRPPCPARSRFPASGRVHRRSRTAGVAAWSGCGTVARHRPGMNESSGTRRRTGDGLQRMQARRLAFPIRSGTSSV